MASPSLQADKAESGHQTMSIDLDISGPAALPQMPHKPLQGLENLSV